MFALVLSPRYARILRTSALSGQSIFAAFLALKPERQIQPGRASGTPGWVIYIITA